jgi:CheY-like chemotaxis protein
LARLDGCSLVITDILMPEMDGFELIRRLVADRPSLPIVATSGATDWPAYLHMATSLGAKAVLHKPVVADELLATVQQILAADPVRRLDDRRATGTAP